VSDLAPFLANSDLGNAALKQVEEFLQNVLNEPGVVLGGLFADKINFRRFRNMAHAVAEAKTLLSDLGLTERDVPLSIIHPLLEGSGLAEEPDVRTIWANLMANAADPRQERPVSATFSDLLKGLTSKDAKFLDSLYQTAKQITNRPAQGKQSVESISFSRENLLKTYVSAGLSRKGNLTSITVKEWDDNREDYEADMREFEFTLEIALARRIMLDTTSPAPIKPNAVKRMIENIYIAQPIPVGVSVTYRFTQTGAAFMRACQPPSPR
jgi:hypothetical protein